MAEREMKVTQEQMAEARLDLAYRDYCAHLLIPLNRCRRRTVSAHFSLFNALPIFLSPVVVVPAFVVVSV
jgi:hypothetical protein